MRRNPQKSTRKLAQEAHVSCSIMQRVLVNDLKVKPYKITKRQLLCDTTKKKRYERSKMLLHKLLDGMRLQVLWTDENLFNVQAIHNSQNDQSWIESKDSVNFECQTSFRRQNPASVMVWAEVTSTGLKTPLTFIEAGVKINQHAYLKMLKDKVVPWVKKVTGNYPSAGQSNPSHSQIGPELVQRQFQVQRTMVSIFS